MKMKMRGGRGDEEGGDGVQEGKFGWVRLDCIGLDWTGFN